jgi:uncharacterized membrane protein
MELLVIIAFTIIYFKINQLENILKSMNRNEHPIEEKTLIQTAKKEKTIIVPLQTPIKPINKKLSLPLVKEKIKTKYNELNIEEFLFGNIILKIGVIAFILGIGLFLKYSIDKNWIPVWGRAMIGIMVGISMLIGGIKLIKNENRLFSEGLFGGGIAILYLSIFAGFALKGFAFLPFGVAFVAMLSITFLAGLISIKFNAKSTAIFGLIGGFLTPFLISSGSQNVIGLLSYMMMLNLGILYISVYKKWAILSWMAFIITALSQLGTSVHQNYQFIPMVGLFGAFFIIYSIVPFINDIKEKKDELTTSFVILFGVNFMVALGSFFLLFEHKNLENRYFAIVTISLALYLLIYAKILSQKSLFLKNLFYVVLAQAIALLLVTPALLFTGTSLTIIWAVESLMLLWIANKSQQETYAIFGLLGFVITIFRYVVFDLSKNIGYSNNYYQENFSKTLSQISLNFAITSFFVLGCLFLAHKILSKSELKFEFKSVTTQSLPFLFFVSTFILTFIGMSSLIFNLFDQTIFTLFFTSFIALFGFWLYKSEYTSEAKFLLYILFALLLFTFITILETSSPTNILITFIKFILFGASFTLLYNLGFKDSSCTIKSYTLGNTVLALGVGLLFAFLNVETQNIALLLKPEASKFAITILWVLFGIVMFVFGVSKENKTAKTVATALIFLAILKAFMFDLSNLDYIFKILLFIILGVLLFGLSYFYQSKTTSNTKKEQ